MRRLLLAGSVLLLLSSAASAQTLLLNQIGPNASYITAASPAASQDFESSFDAYDTGAIDDFTITAPKILTQVQAVTEGFSTFTASSYGNIQDWRVEIYSSSAAAGASLVGNIASTTVSTAAATVATGYVSTDPTSALVTLPVNILLTTPGTYWIAVIPRLDVNGNGQIGVLESSFPGDPSNGNDLQANPGGGFGSATFAPSDAVTRNFAYNISGVAAPEPGSAAILLSAALPIAGAVVGRRRRPR